LPLSECTRQHWRLLLCLGVEGAAMTKTPEQLQTIEVPTVVIMRSAAFENP
jgi:hypothetical protein